MNTASDVRTLTAVITQVSLIAALASRELPGAVTHGSASEQVFDLLAAQTENLLRTIDRCLQERKSHG